MDFLNRVFRGDKVVWVVFMTLLLISIVEVFSAASMLTYGKDNYWWPIRQHSTNLMLGCVVVYVVHLIPYKFYDLEGEKLETIQKEIVERREKAALAVKEAE